MSFLSTFVVAGRNSHTAAINTVPVPVGSPSPFRSMTDRLGNPAPLATAYVTGGIVLALVCHVSRRFAGGQVKATATRSRAQKVACRVNAKGREVGVPGSGPRGVDTSMGDVVQTVQEAVWNSKEEEGMGNGVNGANDRDKQQQKSWSSDSLQYAVWLQKRKDVSALMEEWSNVPECNTEQKDILTVLSKLEVPKGWALWALADPAKCPNGGGIYMEPPCPVHALVFLEPVDAKKNFIHHLVANPATLSEGVKKAVQRWFKTLAPKVSVFKQPDELQVFDIEIMTNGPLGQGESAVVVSKGL